MSDRELRKAELKAIFSEGGAPSATKKPRVSRAKPVPAVAINISGQVNVSGQIAGGDIHNHYAKPPRSPKVVVLSGVGVISEEQKVELARLRDEWMSLHADLKKRPLSHGTAWGRINKAAGVTSYHLIPADKFDLVVAFVKQEMAKLRSMRSAPAKDKAWRASRIGAIKARCANQLGDPDAYKAYIKRNFGADSLSALATDELQRTYQYIMGKKSPA